VGNLGPRRTGEGTPCAEAGGLVSKAFESLADLTALAGGSGDLSGDRSADVVEYATHLPDGRSQVSRTPRLGRFLRGGKTGQTRLHPSELPSEESQGRFGVPGRPLGSVDRSGRPALCLWGRFTHAFWVFSRRRPATQDGTNASTSPPNWAISRTTEELSRAYSGLGIR